jgi:rRNA biogenesis protein RRP5
MSFRSGDLSKESKTSLTLGDLEQGQKVDGLVKKVEDYGIFIQIEGSKLSGLCHKSEVLCSIHFKLPSVDPRS